MGMGRGDAAVGLGVSGAADAYIATADQTRLVWEPRGSCHVLQCADGAIQLNPGAVQVIQQCNGEHTLMQIIARLTRGVEQPTQLARDIQEFVQTALARGWLQVRERAPV
ncbi:pyrroloquinoline quinone biosynthesis peptide chaperone PqqD [Sinimarinibacterium sp. NLF-5-8]|uniref:pyrroloquinoline quinone biosynthesis peptide chaperone PqqD n=1 Tax=Sinimarinibacterium sp. NLF-5-8 TaxID=2698684 RepID=UPI00137C31F1|nr:pyrroloquinoline quinone biosynthesis peptide chaperone PqqD [Sinimarinibacterium sp. NLF-5-8]QHS11302.1 pyrroloquinoline quinone biosynthesis peptide chaperone PqqD [Sinimarinibacterium sp. NLF-5-8]